MKDFIKKHFISLIALVLAVVSVGDAIFLNNNIGASITTILSTDTLKDSRTVINDNFTAINNELATKLSGSYTSTATSSFQPIGNYLSGSYSSTATSSFVSRSDWTTIDNYPSACSAGDYVSAIGDTLTCGTPSSISQTPWGQNIDGGGYSLSNVLNASTTNITVSGKFYGDKSYKTICQSNQCDYTTDGTADQVQIQQAINDIDALGGGTLFFKAGVYNLTATITIPFDPFIKLMGEKLVKNVSGVTATSGGAILAATSTYTTMFAMSGTASASTNADLSHDFEIESMFITGNDLVENCFLMTNVDFFKARDFRLKGCKNGIKTVYSGLDPATGGTKPGGIFLESGSFGVTDNVSGVNVDLQDQTQVWISDVWFSGQASSTIIASSSNKVHISNCEFNTADNSITLGDRPNTATTDITINNNVFAPGSGNKVFNNLMTNASSSRIVFSGNTYPTGNFDSTVNYSYSMAQPFTTPTNTDFSIVPNGTGNVGIGTTSPSKYVHIWRSNSVTNPMLLLEQQSTGDVGLQFLLTNSRAWNFGVDNSDAQNSLKISTNAAGLADSGEYFKLDQLGNFTLSTTTISTALGIGTTTSASKLALWNTSTNYDGWATSTGLMNITNNATNTSALRIDSLPLSMGSQSDPPTLWINNNQHSTNELLRITSISSTSRGLIRLDGTSPDIEIVETDQTAPLGKWEINPNDGLFRITSRNQADNSFDQTYTFNYLWSGGDMMNIYASTTCTTCNFLQFNNSVSSASANYGIDWYNSAGSVHSARIASKSGTSHANSQLTFQVANSNKSLLERMIITSNGSVGIGSSSPTSTLTVMGSTTPGILSIVTSVGSKILEIVNGGVAYLAGIWDFTNATVKMHQYPAFSYATSTAWSGTTTIPLAPAYVAETWSGVKCFTDTGTLNVSFYDGTNRMNILNASTTVNTIVLSTNNSFTASEKRYVDIGTPASSPTKISCTVDKIINQ